MTIGRLAREARVNLETVRYYERIGVMPVPDRTEGGHRSYAPEHAERLKFIRRSRELGFGIETIRRLISLGEAETQACCEVRDMAKDQIASIDAGLEALGIRKHDHAAGDGAGEVQAEGVLIDNRAVGDHQSAILVVGAVQDIGSAEAVVDGPLERGDGLNVDVGVLLVGQRVPGLDAVDRRSGC